MGKKASILEKEERIERAIELLALMPCRRVRAILGEEYQLCRRSCDFYMKLARERMLAHLETTREEERSRAYHELQTIITKEGIKMSDKLKALHLKMGLLGLRAPIQVNVSSPEQCPYPVTEQQAALHNPALLEEALTRSEGIQVSDR